MSAQGLIWRHDKEGLFIKKKKKSSLHPWSFTGLNNPRGDGCCLHGPCRQDSRVELSIELKIEYSLTSSTGPGWWQPVEVNGEQTLRAQGLIHWTVLGTLACQFHIICNMLIHKRHGKERANIYEAPTLRRSLCWAFKIRCHPLLGTMAHGRLVSLLKARELASRRRGIELKLYDSQTCTVLRTHTAQWKHPLTTH